MLDIFFKAGLKDTAEGFLPAKEKHRISCPTGVFTENTKGMEKGERIDFILASKNLYSKATVYNCFMLFYVVFSQPFYKTNLRHYNILCHLISR